MLLLLTSTNFISAMNERIPGKLVALRPATMADRKPVFEWLTKSDLTHRMMGPPLYPDSPVPSWEEFFNDYKPYFFAGSEPFLGRCFIIEVNGEPVGQINHDKIYEKDHSTSLDIWMKSSIYTNKGYGTDAILTLCQYLSGYFGCKKFIIAPSARNTAAIRSYEKAGFVKTDENPDPSEADYTDTIILVKTMN
jgi:RimJ/RimL family protein N-acetyltransferase